MINDDGNGDMPTRYTSSSSEDVDYLAAIGLPPKRLSRKEELVYMRGQVERLTKLLNEVKVAAGMDASTPIAPVPLHSARALLDAGNSANGPSLGLWKRLASAQLERRRTSELQNRMLREAFAKYSRRAKRLYREQQKRTMNEVQHVFLRVSTVGGLS